MSQVYSYPEGWRMRSIVEQMQILSRLFPGLDLSTDAKQDRFNKKGIRVLPDGFDGFAVIPKHSALARYSKANEKWPAYNRALAHVHATMETVRPDFVDYTKGNIGPEYERMTTATQRVFDELEKLPGDVLILAAQTGLLHRNESVEHVRLHYKGQEFGLDSVSVGCILFTHPERLQKFEDLSIDCSGSERAPGADGQFVGAPYFDFFVGRLWFGTGGLDVADPRYGSVSAFLPAPGVKS